MDHTVLHECEPKGLPAAGVPSRLMRRILPLGTPRSVGLVSGRPPPPSPTPTYMRPSWAMWMSPPSWLFPGHSGMLSSSIDSVPAADPPFSVNRDTRFFEPEADGSPWPPQTPPAANV